LEITTASEGKDGPKYFPLKNLFSEESVGLVSLVDSIPTDVGGWIGAGHSLHSAANDVSTGSTLYVVPVMVLASNSTA